MSVPLLGCSRALRHCASSSPLSALRAARPVAASLACTRGLASSGDGDGKGKGGKPSDTWLSKLLHGDPSKMSSSSAIGAANNLYRLVVISTKPEHRQEFLRLAAEVMPKYAAPGGPCRLLAAWQTMIGEMDEIVHLWQYKEGYKSIDEMGLSVFPNDPTYQKFREDTAHMIYSMESQILMQFGFWDDPRERVDKHVYDLRTYKLKPGAMIEWANHWAVGIEHRRSDNQDVAGLFTHIGDLYTVHHIWAYKSFQDRKLIRERSWQNPGWAETVRKTVPLINGVHSRIMTALPYSNLK